MRITYARTIYKRSIGLFIVASDHDIVKKTVKRAFFSWKRPTFANRIIITTK